MLQGIFIQLKQGWTTRKYGLQLGHTHCSTITNLRFADDVLLFAPTLPQLTTMFNDLHNLAEQYGLELHPDKTVILSNLSQRRGRQATRTVQIGNRPVRVLHYEDNTKYLGRKLCFNDYHTTEIDNRIAYAWRKFYTLRQELTNKRYCLRSRIRLFDSTITPTILYGCASWTTTQTLTTKFQRTRRHMLRLIVGTPRRRKLATPSPSATTSTDDSPNTTTLEPWPDYIRRATATAEQHLQKLNLPSWPITYLRRKWRWALRVATQPHNRWPNRAAAWQPQFDLKRITTRRQGHPHKRWEDDLQNFICSTIHNYHQQTTPPHWLELASDTTS